MDFFGILIFGVVVGILFGIGQIILTLNKKKRNGGKARKS